MPASGYGSGPAHLLRAELRDGIATELTEYPVDFAGQNTERALHARLAPSGQAVERVARPIMTAGAPGASALTMSVPRRKPLSMRIVRA